MASYTLDDLSRLIDHTNLHPDATIEDMETLCEEAKQYHFKMVAINSVQSQRCSKFLANTDIHVGAAIGFPLGQTTIASKVFETKDAISNGATEIDYMVNLTEVKASNWDYVKDEMTQIVNICHKASVDRTEEIPCKVIFENCLLTKEEIKQLAEIALEVRPTFIKTSTGFSHGGATVDDVRLMKEIVGDKVQVKAAGGIRDAQTFLDMIRAGATRIGCSAGIPIIEEIKADFQNKGINSIEL